MPPIDPDRPPEGLPAYLQPIHCLGEGGMGAVWSVLDQRTGEIGALKAIRPSLLTDTAIVRRFEREMRTIAQLNHPCIVQVRDVGRLASNAPYMLMEQVDGVPMIDLEVRGRALGELVRLFDRILAALAYAHARRIIHRDLKPDNVLVVEDELGELYPKLMDFGLAMVAVRGQTSTRLTADGMVVGTPAYMAPEQACDEHHKIGPATDLYAFGCMLYELLSGASPHVASSPMALLLAHATKPPRPFVPLTGLTNASQLEPLIMRLMAKDPVDRFELAADVRAELRRSNLMHATETFDDFDRTALGPYGDTLLDMARPDLEALATAQHGEEAAGLGQLAGLALDPSTYRARRYAVHLATPGESMLQVSVLNLREPSLVGRHDERQTLQRYVEDVRDTGQVAVCLVSGPQGIGKSRLVRWLVEDGEARGMLRYLRVSMAANTSASLAVLQALIDHLRLRGLTVSHAEQALLRFFRTSDAEDWRVKGLLELTVRRGNAAPRSSVLGRLDLLLYSALEQLSKGRPLTLWLDDTHHVPARQVAGFVRGLCKRRENPRSSIMVVVIDRAESAAPSDLELEIGKLEEAWLRPGLHLQQMTAGELLALSGEGLSLAPALARHVAQLSSGMPLLAVALARHWHAAGLLERTPDGFVYAGDEALLPVPEAIQHVFTAQLELAFEGIERATWLPLAQLAAVMGETFTFEQLEQGQPLIPSQATLISVDAFLERALQFGLVRSAPVQDNAFSFANSLMRDGLLGNLPSDRQTDLHRAAARAKTELSERGDPNANIEIARHYLVGRSFGQAYEAFVSAAREMLPQARYDEVFHLLDAAQQALASEQGVSGPWDTRMAVIWEMEFEIALARREFNDASDRVGWIRHVADRVNSELWRARATLAQGRLVQRLGRVQEAMGHFKSAEASVRACDEGDAEQRAALLAHALLAHAESAVALERKADVVDAVEEAENIARDDVDDSSLLARALAMRGLIALFDEDINDARRHLDEALTHAHLSGDLRTEAAICDSLADVHMAEGDLESAERCIEHASQCYEALGDFKVIAECHRRLAEIARHQGRTGEAMTHERWIKLLGR